MNGTRNGSNRTMSRLVWPVVLVLALALPGLAGCGSGVAAEDESQGPTDQVTSLQQELTAAKQQLADAQQQLTDLASAAEARHAKSQATMDAIIKVIDDPAAFGTEEEVLDELMTHAAAGAMMADDVFGVVPMREGWQNTLFGDVDATIKTWHRWLSEDGSMGGALWTWSGTNLVGEPFELIGITLNSYDEQGKATRQFVTYPYEAAYVWDAFVGQ